MARQVAEAGGDEARQAWTDLAWIESNAAQATLRVGKLDDARRLGHQAALAARCSNQPFPIVLGIELEALRVDVLLGQVEQARPEIESRLVQVRHWWVAQRAGQLLPNMPEELLDRVYIAALDVAEDMDRARGDLTSALQRVESILEAEIALNWPATKIAETRQNRAILLARLGREFAKAKSDLEACISVFTDDPVNCAVAFSSLAQLYADQGDLLQAVRLEEKALAKRAHLPHPGERAISHHNLAGYLKCLPTPESLAEAPRHQLAALVYLRATGRSEDARISSLSYARDFRRAQASGATVTIPRVHDLLDDPAFNSLARWLRLQQVDLVTLQADIDDVLNQAKP